MIRVADNLWIGTAPDEERGDLRNIDAILNVAQDLQGTRGWNCGIVYAQVGLVDGPGNPLEVYAAAVLALHALLRHHSVMVCCHGGSRSAAVVVMHANLVSEGRRTWDEVAAILNERIDNDVLPKSHAAHRAAYDRMPWDWLRGVVR